jgi:hypothetical protein
MLHIDGGHPSFRTFIGGIPMLTSMNMAAQLHKVARLKEKLRDASASRRMDGAVTESEPADELSPAR